MKTIDFHAHVLPGMDHGCIGLQMSLQQLHKAKKAGINTVVATPHFYPHIDTVEQFLGRRLIAWEQLQKFLSPALPAILLGAEILVCEGMEAMTGLMRLAVNRTDILLLEMPSPRWNGRLHDTAVQINALCSGHAVIAHCDRYDSSYVDALFECGLHGQLNVNGLCKKRNRPCMVRWVENRKIVGLGSDIHGISGAYKKFKRVQLILGHSFTETMELSESMLFDPLQNR